MNWLNVSNDMDMKTRTCSKYEANYGRKCLGLLLMLMMMMMMMMVMMWTLLLKAGDVKSCLRGIITPLRMYLELSLARRLELFGR